jgi:hypothetical protein
MVRASPHLIIFFSYKDNKDKARMRKSNVCYTSNHRHFLYHFALVIVSVELNSKALLKDHKLAS